MTIEGKFQDADLSSYKLTEIDDWANQLDY